MARGKLRPHSETKTLLRDCQAAGWRTAVVQKGSRRRTKFELKEMNLDASFMVQVILFLFLFLSNYTLGWPSSSS